MTDTSTPSTTAPRQQRDRAPAEPTAWVGFIFFAAVILMLVGSFQAIAGLTALFSDSYFVVRPGGLVVRANYTAWGWTHLVLGIVTVAAGLGVLSGRTWARVWAIVLAGLSAVVNLAFLAAYPVWAVMMITLDVLVIWALAVHGRETATE